MIKVFPSETAGHLRVISSKSFGHRELILAYLTGQEVVLENLAMSEDIQATCSCLKALSAEITENAKGIAIKAGGKKNKAALNCNESGTTLRFMFVLAAAEGVECSFDGSDRLRERPIKELISALQKKGIQCSAEKLPLQIKGKLNGGTYEIGGGISSQYISALLLALPRIKERCNISIDGEIVSEGYIDITIDCLKKYGIGVQKTDSGYLIHEDQEYLAPVDGSGKSVSSVEGDWSNAAFWIAAGLLTSEQGVLITGLKKDSVQGDRKILEIFRKMGGNITDKGDGFLVRKSRLSGIEVDAENIPDLVPILAGTAAFAEGRTVITNVERLREKESDRIESVLHTVNKLGGVAEYKDKQLVIIGNRPAGGAADGFNDHRIVMTAAVMGLASEKGVTISGYKAVKKSYPDFFEKLQSIGGKVDV